ncbi:hypothetical protein [Olleya sp. ITB9]|uniref:hypothetical protein n=1 Tax=Olleya sp. ITB9 TaxID=1715648 RepID=UPI0006CFE13B|nr:hypothetical protein [Olleya sp. ITB9]
MQDYLKPYYSIYRRMGCAGEIYVNDVPLTFHSGITTSGSKTVTGDIPINHLLLESGSYKVTGIMLPRHKMKTLTKDEYMSLDFYIAEGDTSKLQETRKKFHPRIKQPWNGLSEKIEYPIFKITTEINVNLPFVLNGWQNSINLKTIKEKDLFNEVLKFYYQLHGVLASHNASKFLDLSKDKMELQEKAFYFTKKSKADFLNGATSLFSQKLELLPLNSTNLKLQIMGYGKLVRLVRLDGSSALQYKIADPEINDTVKFDIKLHMKTLNKGLSII